MQNCNQCPWSNNYTWNERQCGCDDSNKSYCPIEHYDDKHIENHQPLYVQGLGWGMKTHCFKIYIENGVKMVRTNNGYVRKESDVLANTGDVCTSKNSINKRLRQSWMSKSIPDDGWNK